MKKTIVFFVLLTLPVLYAAAAAQSETAAASHEVITINWVGLNHKTEGTPEDSWVGQQLRKRFPNVRIVPNNVDQTNRDKLLLMANSGELPEFGFIMKIHGFAYDFYLDGITRTIPFSMIREYAPNLTKMLDDDPVGWLVRKVDDAEEMYAMPALKEYKGGIAYEPFFRYDWLQRIGKEPRQVKDLEPENDPGRYLWAKGHQYRWDELEDILVAIRDGDLDGNGRDDTIPFGVSKEEGYWRLLAGMFGTVVYTDFNVRDADGDTTMAVISEDYRDFLKLMAKWYEMRLIDREFMSITNEKLQDLRVEGNMGVIMGTHNSLKYDEGRADNYPMLMFERVPESKIVMTDPFIGPNGKTGVPASVGASTWVWNTLVRADVSDEKLAAALEIYDYVNCTVEGHIMSVYGEEDTHFDWAGEPYNSYAERRPGLPGTGGQTGFWFYNAYFRPAEYNRFFDSPNLAEVLNYYRDTAGPEKYSIPQYREDLFGDTNVRDLSQKYGATLDTIAKEFFAKAISGAIDIDSEWDAYVAKFLRSGGDEMIAEISKAPILSELKKGNIVY